MQLKLKTIYKTLAKVVIKIVITKFLNTQLKRYQPYRITVKRRNMKIKTSKYNEVRLSDVAQYIKVPAQIVKPSFPNGVLIGDVHYEDGKKERVYSDYEVRINNVQFPFAAGEDDYFNSEIEIN